MKVGIMMELNETKNGKKYKEIEYTGYNAFTGTRDIVIYKYNRGVIGISPKEDFSEEILDGYKDSYHVDATIEISKKMGVKLTNTISPYEAGIEASQNDIVIMQLDGNQCMLYLPNRITEFQKKMILEEIWPRKDYVFGFTHGERTIDYIDLQYVINILDSITASRKK